MPVKRIFGIVKMGQIFTTFVSKWIFALIFAPSNHERINAMPLTEVEFKIITK